MSQSAGVVNTQTSDERCLKPYDNTTCQQVAFKADFFFFLIALERWCEIPVWCRCMTVHWGQCKVWDPAYIIHLSQEGLVRLTCSSFKNRKAREGKLSPGPRPPKQDERLHEGHQSDYHTLHRLTGGGVLMVAVWLRSTKTDVVKLLSFLAHNMSCNACCARARLCMCVCSNHLQEQN